MLSEKNSISHQLNEISIYHGGCLTDSVIVLELAKAKVAFPALPVDFFKILADRLKANGFTDERLKDSISQVIDTCPYPTPTIANFISFDRKIKILHYEDMLKKVNELGPDFSKIYSQVKLPGIKKLVWVNCDDIQKYKLEVYKPSEK